MEDIKTVVAKNISDLRQMRKMTQIELASHLNYSDKAVSKWERGESLPDVTVLKKIADLFDVPLDYLVRTDHSEPPPAPVNPMQKRRSRGFITAISVLLVWLVATLCYFLTDIIMDHHVVCWLAFVYAVPASMIVWLVFNSIWFNRRINYVIISLLMWSGLICIFVTLLALGVNIWRIFLLGIPGQIIIALWSRIRFRPSK